MFLIFEGPDGSGKTTLAKDLERQGWTYHHEGPPPICSSLIEHYEQLILKAKPNTVFDRLYLGETIYGPILRGEDKLGQPGVDKLNRVVSTLGGRTIIFLPGVEKSWNNIRRRKGELITDYKIHQEIYEKYYQFALDSKADYSTYDYDHDFGYTLGSQRL